MIDTFRSLCEATKAAAIIAAGLFGT